MLTILVDSSVFFSYFNEKITLPSSVDRLHFHCIMTTAVFPNLNCAKEHFAYSQNTTTKV